jgi:hypothetical protein
LNVIAQLNTEPVAQVGLEFYARDIPGARELIAKHAAAFVSFAPRSLEFLHGLREDVARQLCDAMMVSGELERFRIGGELWYRAKPK